MELSDKIYDDIDVLSREGNNLMDNELFDAAVHKWTQALDLLPEPKATWEAFMWLSASVGDAQLQQQLYEPARNSFLDALNAPGGVGNPFINYRLGQCQMNLGNEELGIEYLLRAYMLDGEEIFLAEDSGVELLNILKNRNLIG